MSITELFFNTIFFGVDSIFSIIPRLYLPESFHTAMELLQSFVADVSFFLPMPTIANIITLVIAWYFVTLIFSFLNFVLRKVPLLGIR